MRQPYRNLITMITAVIVSVSSTVVSAQTADQVVGTVVRFSAGSSSIDVSIGEDNPTVRDFLSRLPLTIKLEEYAGREKIGYLSPKLTTEGSPGSDPQDGDLIYFVPWGNIGFYYDTSGIGYSDHTIHIGTYTASLVELEKLEGKSVHVEITK
jgi:hypothetical protein